MQYVFSISRFLVFTDDHTPLYAILPSLHLVCNPCKFGCWVHLPTVPTDSKQWQILLLFLVTVVNPLDDIGNDFHRSFMKGYLDIWPYPPRAKYETGQIISAEVNGVQQKCKVLAVDCDLIQVVFQVSAFFKITQLDSPCSFSPQWYIYSDLQLFGCHCS